MNIVPYRHPRFQPGTTVYIDPSSREEDPLYPLADQTVRVTGRWISLSAFLYIMRSEKQVPVIFRKDIWYVNEEYIRPLYSVERTRRAQTVKR